MEKSLSAVCNQKIVCSCGREHFCPIEKVVVRPGALNDLNEMLCGYEKIFLAADDNTYKACGEKVKELLKEKIVGVLVYHRNGVLVPDEASIAELEAALCPDADLILGVGSGVINDLCKYVSFKRDMPYGIVATAPSMDGYASSGAAMIFSGMKVTETTRPPRFIISDVDVACRAPMEMIRAGYGDIIGKYSSLCDWKLSALICGEHFCQEIYDLVYDATCEIRALAKEIQARNPEAIGKLMNALVLIGVTLSLLGSTRPGSGSEHHLSHFFEIVGLLRGEEYLVHGTDVAYSTVVTAKMRDEIKKMEAPVFLCESAEEREAQWTRIYASLTEEIRTLQKDAGSYEKDLTGLYSEKWQEILSILKECPSEAECEEMLLRVGYSLEDFENLYGKEKIRDAMFYGKDLKNRYSVLWLYYSLFSGNK